jgi:hypothetical protein
MDWKRSVSCDDFYEQFAWIGLPATSTFFMSHRASFAKHTNTICKNMHKNPSALLQSEGKNKK